MKKKSKYLTKNVILLLSQTEVDKKNKKRSDKKNGIPKPFTESTDSSDRVVPS